jgi:hypothetical protein
MARFVDLISDYPVSTGEVRLKIVIGDAQIGSSVVKLGRKVIARGDIDNLLVGNGPELPGRKLNIKTMVNDVNPQTDRTDVLYIVKGGAHDNEWVCSYTAPQGGEVVYRARFNLVAASPDRGKEVEP